MKTIVIDDLKINVVYGQVYRNLRILCRKLRFEKRIFGVHQKVLKSRTRYVPTVKLRKCRWKNRLFGGFRGSWWA